MFQRALFFAAFFLNYCAINASDIDFPSLFSEHQQFFRKNSPLILEANYHMRVDEMEFVLFSNRLEDTPENRQTMSSGLQMLIVNNVHDGREFIHYGFDIYLKNTETGPEGEKIVKGQKIGYVTTTHDLDKININWLLINVEHRRQGYARHVLKMLEGIYRSRIPKLPPECHQLYLMTAKNNPLARASLREGYQLQRTPIPKSITFTKNFKENARP